MSPSRFVSAVLCTLALAGCASTVDEASSPRHPVSTTDLVPDGPANAAVSPARARSASDVAPERAVALGGKVFGADFFPIVAIAVPGKTPGWRELQIYDYETSCGAKGSLLRTGNRRVIAQVPWHVGGAVDAQESSLSESIYSRDEDDWKSRALASGTLTVLEASADSQTFGRVRIEARDGSDTLSGTIYVVVCAK